VVGRWPTAERRFPIRRVSAGISTPAGPEAGAPGQWADAPRGHAATRLPGRGEPRNVVTKYTKEELAGERQDVGFEPPEGGTPNGAGGQPDLAGRWCPTAGGASAYVSLQRDKAAPPYRSCQTLRALAVSASPRSNERLARHRKRTIVIEDRRTSRLRYTSPRQGTRTIEAAVIQADRRVRRNAETRRTQRGAAATNGEWSADSPALRDPREGTDAAGKLVRSCAATEICAVKSAPGG
jgi:hypothetical protein